MKKSSIIGVLILCFTFWGKAQVRNEIRVPDPEGYRTLKCDFHIHTVFSDGLSGRRYVSTKLTGRGWMQTP